MVGRLNALSYLFLRAPQIVLRIFLHILVSAGMISLVADTPKLSYSKEGILLFSFDHFNIQGLYWKTPKSICLVFIYRIQNSWPKIPGNHLQYYQHLASTRSVSVFETSCLLDAPDSKLNNHLCPLQEAMDPTGISKPSR
jgi:hypothetical protein